MAIGESWSRLEVEACVADYLQMLALELNGQRFNKTQHAQTLAKKLEGRSRQSIEFKHCNISAVMLMLGYPYIDGYKPRGNYQSLLLEVVEDQLMAHDALEKAAQAAVSRPASEITQVDTLSAWVPPPKAPGTREGVPSYAPRFSPVVRDYLAQEARNRSLGLAGELFVAKFEALRLHEAGKKKLSTRVEHVAHTRGDGLGFDVLSFDESGKERLIEVKTTAFGELTPFYVSRNEIARSEADSPRYWLYRVFDFRRRPRLFSISGAITNHFGLEPTTYLARLAG